MSQLIWVVISIKAGRITDVELLDQRPRWNAADMPLGITQLVRAGYINGCDTSEEFEIVGTDATGG